MPRIRMLVFCSGAVLAATAAIALLLPTMRQRSQGESELFEPPAHTIQPEPLCPWREPDADMARLFHAADRRASETRILSGRRVELSMKLGRPLTAGENSLTLSRVFKQSHPLGFVQTWRVKGEHGAIELVLATSLQGEVLKVRLQRSREPEAVARALEDQNWLGRFEGRTQARGWDVDDITALPSEARLSGTAIRDRVRDLLILLAGSEGAPRSAGVTSHD